MSAIVIVIIVFEANAQHKTTFADLGHRQEADPQNIPGSHPCDLLARFLVGREVDRLWVWRSYDENLGYVRQIVENHCNNRQRWWCNYLHDYQL